uniref:hypothetical protein n=1 Tax=Polaribacter sp. TaxID=1920175 RepID=UPI004048B05C
MEFTKGENAFIVLREKLKTNKKKILVYKILSPILMVLFIVFSFLIFYNNNVNKISSDLNLLFYGLLVGLFICLAAMDYIMSKKIKENKYLDNRIYKLLKI